MAKKLNIAVVGAGAWGKNLVRTFNQLGVLHTVCDQSPVTIAEVQKTYPKVNATREFQDILNNPAIDGVVIATPAAYHFECASAVLNHNKHVFVEKPLSLNVEQGEALVKLAAEKKLTLMVGHILYYHNAVLKLKSMIEAGELGKIQYIYSNRLNIGKIRSEENILWSFAPHDISVILMLLNEFPESVFTSGGSYLQEKIVDVTMTLLNFKSGTKAHIFVSWLHPFKEHKLVVVGDKKMAVFDDISKEKLFVYPHKVEWKDRAPVAFKAEAEIIPVAMEEPLLNECEHFLGCIANKTKPRTDGAEGLRVLRVLEESQKSLNSSQPSYFSKSSIDSQDGYFVHSSSCIDKDVLIGEQTKIWHYSHILSGSKIGKQCNIGQNVVIGPHVTIGNQCKIQNNVSVYKGVTLEDGVFCGPSMVFTNVFNPRSTISRMDELKTTLVRQGATIGANATIICGITIGRYAFIGAGAVVTKDVPDFALVYGNPGKIQGWMCECGNKLEGAKSNHLQCGHCQKKFVLKKDSKFTQILIEDNLPISHDSAVRS